MKIRKKFLLYFQFVIVFFSVACVCAERDEKEVENVGLKKNEELVIIQENSAANLDKDKVKDDNLKEIECLIEDMSLEEKVAQLFIVLPEDLIDGVECVVAAGDMTKEAIEEIAVGGFIYLNDNLQSEEQVKTMLANVQKYNIDRLGVPAFLCVDEEGGTVTRISGTGKFDVPTIENMSEIGQEQNVDRAYEVGKLIGEYLQELGFNVNFAPVADVLTNSQNTVVKYRAFGDNPQNVSDMALEVMRGLEESDIYATYKHFPGHGMTSEDTHEGFTYSEKTLEELEKCELIPFQAGIDSGLSFMMIGHIAFPEITGRNIPASLSYDIITELLREKMGYNGIVLTDAMNMGAIAQQFSSSEAAIMAIQAGADIILMPEDFKSAYQGILEAVKNNNISEKRIDESLRRILSIKVRIKDRETENV